MLHARAWNSAEAELLPEAAVPVSLRFNPSQAMTLGVEIELQIVDAATLDLAPGAPSILEALRGVDLHVKPELYQSILEINTGICVDVRQVRDDLTRALSVLRAACEPLGFDLVSAGTHPFALYGECVMFPAERYRNLIDRNRWLTQRLLSFGLHVHIGMRDGEHAMAMMNAMLNYLPHLLALSASSPYWQGRDTGLASSRITLFEALPTAGHPCVLESWDAFEAFYQAMIRSRAITSIKDIWWDIRPHPDFGTVEIRICDALPTLSETLALVALIQALYHWFDELYRDGWPLAPPPYWLLRENKWRASRWGLEAEIVLDEHGHTRPLRADVEQLVETLTPRTAMLGSRDALEMIEVMMERGVSYERQRKMYVRDRSYKAVLEALVQELETDLPIV